MGKVELSATEENNRRLTEMFGSSPTVKDAQFNYPPREWKRMTKRRQAKIQAVFQRQAKIQANSRETTKVKFTAENMNRSDGLTRTKEGIKIEPQKRINLIKKERGEKT